MGIGVPSIADIKNSVASAASSTVKALSGAGGRIRDLGGAALARTQQLSSDGVDLGRRAVNSVRTIDVREAASTVRIAISESTEAARGGIKAAVEWTGQQEHRAAEFARNHIPGGDNPLSNGLRSAITAEEDVSRFTLGAVGGITREVVGLAGTLGELGTTGVEMQLSPEASAEYGQKLLSGVSGAINSTGEYIDSAARDPGRIGADVSRAISSAKAWGDGQLDRYQQAIRSGKGPETIGLDVGAVTTYVVPIGGGPARGLLTGAVRAGTEAVARDGAEVAVRSAAETIGREGAATANGLKPLTGLADIAERTGASERRLQEVLDLPPGQRPPPSDYLSAQRISDHLSAFDEGASRFSLAKNVDKYGLGQRDGTTFVMTRADADALVRSTAGDPRKLEEALGLPKGQLDGAALVRVDFPPAALDDLGLRMPSGNEAGANENWLPGGYLPSGADEAVVDGGRAAPDQYSISRVK